MKCIKGWLERLLRPRFRSIIILLFPSYESRLADRIIANKMDKLQDQSNQETELLKLEGIKIFMDMAEEEAIGFINQTFEYKGLLEEKAKVNIIGISIISSVIFGISAIILNSEAYFPNIYLGFVIFIIALYIIIELVLAVILSIKVLTELNIHYQLLPSDLFKPQVIKQQIIGFSYEMNIYQNVRRNNYINSSYKSIRNALISLLVLFILISLISLLS